MYALMNTWARLNVDTFRHSLKQIYAESVFTFTQVQFLETFFHQQWPIQSAFLRQINIICVDKRPIEWPQNY